MRAWLVLILTLPLAACAQTAPVTSSDAPPAESVSLPDSLDGRFTTWVPEAEAMQSGTLDDVVQHALAADVLFLGEQHDDAVTHALQHHLLNRLAATTGRPIVLAMEMFETDVQLVLDEYVAGTIREKDFLEAARPWPNYDTDYRPLVETARERGWPVIAANAPGRYVSLVAQHGEEVLGALQPAALRTMPERPHAGPSADYADKFLALMSNMDGHGSPHGGPTPESMLAAQNLRDVTMANSIEEALAAHENALIVHVNGAFHSEGGLGIPDHLSAETEAVVVTFRPAKTLDAAPEPSGDDIMVLTASE